MLSHIKNFMVWFFQPLSCLFDKPYYVEFLEDPVDSPQKKVLYVVGTEDEPWQVEFLCPCGCKDKIILPVNDNTSPRWIIEIISNIPTLSPSIWRSKGCKSHFFLRYGKIQWCKNTG